MADMTSGMVLMTAASFNIMVWMWMAYVHTIPSLGFHEAEPAPPTAVVEGHPQSGVGGRCVAPSGYIGRQLVPELCRPQRRVLFGP